ncbi:sensor histidine kinase [Paenibacillus thalictri]|uniref:Sensor histidine kinase n=1 Tax=Paenibacillus thalictri TaxID=2527873 RepID=A0A4Q9DXL9_9BACL|nr:sensor histidine kinase [Paenibacillus thalictri]TBL81125.1 sensor histidine kinase [Paenibacillus thalictri]
MLWYKLRSIRTKILAAFIALIMVPMLLIAAFNYLKSASILEKQAGQQFHHLSEITNRQFDQYFTNLDVVSMNIVESPVIQNRLQQKFVPSILWTPKQIAEEAEVKSFLSGIHKLVPGLSGIAVYGFNGIIDYYHPSWTISLDYSPTQEYWYREAAMRNGRWLLSGKRTENEFSFFKSRSEESVITFARLVRNLDTLEPMGVLAINIKVNALESILGIAETARPTVIKNENGQLIMSTAGAEAHLSDNDWLQTSSVSPVTGWTSIQLVYKEELFAESKNIRNYIIAITVVLSILAVVLAHLLASGIVKPLLLLKRKMQEIEQGQFQGDLVPIHHDEVGELTQRFNLMMTRMRSLLDEIRSREQQKAQLEMDALQARINPHFLYNTLMALRIQAVTDGNLKLGELISSLVHLLKFSAKNKRKEIKLKHELELLGEYVKLLQLRNENFDFSQNVESGMEENMVFPFLLQPIVENAIFHGIGPLQRRGRIRVALYTSQGCNMAVIEDNGVGMEEAAALKLLMPGYESEENDHLHKIGLRNVYERLKLQFGDKADMVIDSAPGNGTRITIQWPIKKDGKDFEHESAIG